MFEKLICNVWYLQYGKVEALVISGMKNGSALIEMDSPEAAVSI